MLTGFGIALSHMASWHVLAALIVGTPKETQ